MNLSVNCNEQKSAYRLLEFFANNTPWHRSLWGVGLPLAIYELYEACIVRQQGHLSDGSLRRMISSLQKRSGKTPCLSTQEKQHLQNLLKTSLRAEGADHYGLKTLADDISGNYLSRWECYVSTETNFSVELFAREVAAYLLDLGFSEQFLYQTITDFIHSHKQISLSQLCNELQEKISANEKREFKALLGFVTIPIGACDSTQWLYRQAVTNWLTSNNFSTSEVRAPAAILINVQARDPIGAAQAARYEADRYSARALIGTGKALSFTNSLWIEGHSTPFPLIEQSRGVRVKGLYREKIIFQNETDHNINAALELLAHLEHSSPAAAIAGGWAAIEGLLSAPNDRSSAADSLATLTACSFPRAELTQLSYSLEKEYPDQYLDLKNAQSNKQRCQILAEMILQDNIPNMRLKTDTASLDRLKKLLDQPQSQLRTIQAEISDSFHRLYRQRNLILHGARLDSVSLMASLRTVSKLAGAGLDRITHSYYAQNIKPQELVSKANLAIATLDEKPPTECLNLLE